MEKVWASFKAVLEFIGAISDLWWLAGSVSGVAAMLYEFYMNAPPWDIFFATLISIFILPLTAISWAYWTRSELKRTTGLCDVHLEAESSVRMLYKQDSNPVYFIVERFIVTNSSTSTTFNLDVFLKPRNFGKTSLKMPPLQHKHSEWEELQQADEVLKMDILSFPLTLPPKACKCGYLAFRFNDLQSLKDIAFDHIRKEEFITAATRFIELSLVLRNLETEEERIYEFITGNLVAAWSSAEHDLTSFFQHSIQVRMEKSPPSL